MFNRFFLAFAVLLGVPERQMCAQHVHENHPVTLHHGYNRVELAGPGHSNPIVKVDSSGQYMIFNEWLINSTCNDKLERGNGYTRSVLHRVHVSVEGELEWGAEAGAKLLAAELKTYSKARVQLNGGWSGEWKEELSFSSKTKLQKCQKIWYVFLKNRKKVSGSVDTWEHKITCMQGSTGKLFYNYCSKRTLKGAGIGWGTHLGEHVQRGLVDPCPCSEIDPDSKHVFNPTVPVPVPDPSPGEDTEEDDSPPPADKEEPPKWELMNPLKKEADKD